MCGIFQGKSLLQVVFVAMCSWLFRAYRQTYHGHVQDELVCRSLKEKSLASNV
jgi:hypothetical protein